MMGRSISEGKSLYRMKSTGERRRDIPDRGGRTNRGVKEEEGEGGSEIAFNPARFNTSDKFCRRIN